MLVIFPFEVPFYEQAQVPATFVGHPLVELAAPPGRPTRFCGRMAWIPRVPSSPSFRAVGATSLRALLPNLVRTAALIVERVPDAQFVLARRRTYTMNCSIRWRNGRPPPLDHSSLENHSDDILASAAVALVASGTATVQAALHGCPMVVVYRLAPLTYRLGKPFVDTCRPTRWSISWPEGVSFPS